ncbi:MAG: transglycosylase SLT domain-containing protein [Chloroflexota bacterium]
MERFASRWRRFAASGLLVILIVSLAWPALADESSDGTDQEDAPVTVDPAIQTMWERTDGEIAAGTAQRTWLFGPEPVATSYEHYPQSQTGYRTIVYYDKGRLEISNTEAAEGSLWAVSGGLLVSEMLSGYVQLGEREFARRELPEVPLVGDDEQDNPVTYADLAEHATVWDPEDIEAIREGEEDADQGEEHEVLQEEDDGPRYLSRVGEPVTELLTPDGEVIEGAVTEYDVTVAAYDEFLGHNVASTFANWSADLPLPALNLLGLPISEPYWIETEVDDEPTMVLVQAFERRLLSYTPNNPEGWRVESGNVGTHYRNWRDLERPDLPELQQLAEVTPSGETIIKAATDFHIDPYIFVALSQHLSAGDPLAEASNGGRGLLGVQDEDRFVAGDNGEDVELDLRDPTTNAKIAAEQFAEHMYAAWDWPTIVGNYYADGEVEISEGERSALVEDVMTTYQQLLEEYPPSEPLVDPAREHGKFLGEGRVAYYGASYTPEWWEGAMERHASWGNAVEDWEYDPNGYYCVHPDYYVGELMRVEANGVTIVCTIGDRVAEPHHTSWRSRWALEMNWDAFTALELDRNNHAEVYYLGEREVEPPEEETPEETAVPSETASPEPTGTGEPTGSPTETSSPEPTGSSEPTATPETETPEEGTNAEPSPTEPESGD